MNPFTWLTRFFAVLRRKPTSEQQADIDATPVLMVHASATEATEATATQATTEDDPNADERFMSFVSDSLGGMIAGHFESVAAMLPLGPNGERVIISNQFEDLRELAGQLRVLASLIDVRIPEQKQAPVLEVET